MKQHLRTLKFIIGLGAAFVLGAALAPGSVQAAVNYFNETKVVSGSGSANCGYGWKMTGGGVASLPSDYFTSTSSTEYKLTGSQPSFNGWKATAKVTRGTYSSYNDEWRYTTSSQYPTVYAVCAR
jgi:hypothetical protein